VHSIPPLPVLGRLSSLRSGSVSRRITRGARRLSQ